MQSPLLGRPAEHGSPSHRATWVWSARDLLSPLLGTSVLLPFAVAFVGVIISVNPALEPYTPILLSTVVLSQALGTLAFSRFSAFVACTNVDLLSAVFLANLGPILHRPILAEAEERTIHCSDADCGDVLLAHILVAQCLFTLLIGSMLCLVAALDGIWYLRFFPYPVACGFVSGIGLLVLDGGFELGTGRSMWDLAVGWAPPDPIGEAIYLRAGATLLVGLFFLSLKRVMHSTLRLPAGLLAVSGAVHLAAWLLGFSREDIAAEGVYLDGLTAHPAAGSGWAALISRIGTVHPHAFINESVVSLTVSYTLLHLLSYPFYAAGMQDVDPTARKLDLNREIYRLGCTNVALGLLCGVPSYYSYKVCLIMKRTGAKSRLWVVLLGATFLAIYMLDAWVRPAIALVPQCAFAGLVLSLGVDFLLGSLVESKRRVANMEWRAVLVTAVLTYFNVMLGIVFGSLLTMGIFIIEYAGITGIVRKATLAEVRSLIKRPREEARFLQEFGLEVAIFWCSGYIFFGTAFTIVQEIEAHLDSHPGTHAVIVDFESVPAVDASGVHALTEFAARCNTRMPRVRICFCGLVRRLRLALQNVITSRSITGGPRLEKGRLETALEWAEEQVLQRAKACASIKAAGRTPARLNGPGPPVVRRPSGSVGGSASAGGALSLPSPGADAVQPRPSALLELAGGQPGRLPSTLELLTALLLDIAPGAPPAERSAAAALLAPWSQVKAYEAKGARPGDGLIYSEGDPATDLFYIVSGAVSLTRGLQAEPTHAVKMPRHHLNSSKGDLFVFEERSVVRVQVVEEGTVLGAIEFGASDPSAFAASSATGRASSSSASGTTAPSAPAPAARLMLPRAPVPRRVTSATASPKCEVLHVPYERLHEAFARYPAAGHAAMAWLSKLASAQVLEHMKGGHAKPYRLASLDEPGFPQAFSFSPKHD